MNLLDIQCAKKVQKNSAPDTESDNKLDNKRDNSELAIMIKEY